MKETKQKKKKKKGRDGKCEKWELKSESEVPEGKFPDISLLSGFEVSMIQIFDSVSQKQIFCSLLGIYVTAWFGRSPLVNRF